MISSEGSTIVWLSLTCLEMFFYLTGAAEQRTKMFAVAEQNGVFKSQIEPSRGCSLKRAKTKPTSDALWGVILLVHYYS